MTPSTNDPALAAPATALPFTFGGFTVPAECRRIFITAVLEPASGDPRIQPTGFPDLGPVLYADPAEKHGLICLIESEASMANRLEEVCLANKYEGTLRDELAGLPYIKLTADGTATGAFITASTVDGHRFASEYIMGGHIVKVGAELNAIQSMNSPAATADAATADAAPAPTKKTAKGKQKKTAKEKPEFVRFVQSFMGMTTKDRCPAANVPRMFRLAMEYDPLALLHGFQISVKDKLTFVGLRSPRAITASILGLNCQRITVPGVRLDPIGTGDAGQAIFQKQRISARKIEARFSVDVGLLASMHLGSTPEQAAERLQLLLKVALCKIGWFLTALSSGLRLRTDCDLRIVTDAVRYWTDRMGADGTGTAFDFAAITTAATGLAALVTRSGLDPAHSPFPLKHVARAKEDKEEKQSGEGAEPVGHEDEAGTPSDEESGD
jgi:CRISPR-associated protein Csb1